MSEQTYTVLVGDNLTVKVVFDYQKAEPEVDLQESVEVEQVFALNEGGFQIGDIIYDLSEPCLDRLKVECFEYMKGE